MFGTFRRPALRLGGMWMNLISTVDLPKYGNTLKVIEKRVKHPVRQTLYIDISITI